MNFITIELPEDVFESGGATIERVKRISLRRVADLRRMALSGNAKDIEIYAELASIYPHWQGVVSVDDNTILDDPINDIDVFSYLDSEQLNWLMSEGLRCFPTKAKKASS